MKDQGRQIGVEHIHSDLGLRNTLENSDIERHPVEAPASLAEMFRSAGRPVLLRAQSVL